jgi:hypothetical protein
MLLWIGEESNFRNTRIFSPELYQLSYQSMLRRKIELSCFQRSTTELFPHYHKPCGENRIRTYGLCFSKQTKYLKSAPSAISIRVLFQRTFFTVHARKESNFILRFWRPIGFLSPKRIFYKKSKPPDFFSSRGFCHLVADSVSYETSTMEWPPEVLSSAKKRMTAIAQGFPVIVFQLPIFLESVIENVKS